MQHVLIRPAAGMHIRDPRDGSILPAEGRTVELTSFWRRRLKEGGVELPPRVTTTAKKSDKTDKGDAK